MDCKEMNCSDYDYVSDRCGSSKGCKLVDSCQDQINILLEDGEEIPVSVLNEFNIDIVPGNKNPSDLVDKWSREKV